MLIPRNIPRAVCIATAWISGLSAILWALEWTFTNNNEEAIVIASLLILLTFAAIRGAHYFGKHPNVIPRWFFSGQQRPSSTRESRSAAVFAGLRSTQYWILEVGLAAIINCLLLNKHADLEIYHILFIQCLIAAVAGFLCLVLDYLQPRPIRWYFVVTPAQRKRIRMWSLRGLFGSGIAFAFSIIVSFIGKSDSMPAIHRMIWNSTGEYLLVLGLNACALSGAALFIQTRLPQSKQKEIAEVASQSYAEQQV